MKCGSTWASLPASPRQSADALAGAFVRLISCGAALDHCGDTVGDHRLQWPVDTVFVMDNTLMNRCCQVRVLINGVNEPYLTCVFRFIVRSFDTTNAASSGDPTEEDL